MNFPFSFRPRLVDALKHYTRQDFVADLIAGLTVGLVALPLAMAFAIASGAPPQAGIFTAVIAGFMISALGGTKVAIGGPTGAFIVILYGIGAHYGPENLAICTILAGIILFVMGAARLGTAIKFIPYPVTMGFTSGIAVLIFTTQIKDFFGLKLETQPSEFFDKMKALAACFGSLQWPALALSAASLGLILFWPKAWQRHAPGDDRRADFGDGGGGVVQPAGGNHRQQISRDTAGAAGAALAGVRVGQCAASVPPGVYDRAPGRH